ncbi:unnamed protein product [Protopolystoma xenopodis]|uniref:Tektin n=1 Tax=Protopolystoma xenopodis TaxID=117903 RepID=A0A3S5A158_9PLAT|nr:unnamed protein product [Protopolystoma xenopodis]
MVQTKQADLCKLREELSLQHSTLTQLEARLTRVSISVEHVYAKLSLVRVISKRDRAKMALGVHTPIETNPEELLKICLNIKNQLLIDLEDYDLQDERIKYEEDLVSQTKIYTRRHHGCIYQLIIL